MQSHVSTSRLTTHKFCNGSSCLLQIMNTHLEDRSEKTSSIKRRQTSRIPRLFTRDSLVILNATLMQRLATFRVTTALDEKLARKPEGKHGIFAKNSCKDQTIKSKTSLQQRLLSNQIEKLFLTVSCVFSPD